MAEIEFKRRGTPVWAVALVLLVIAGVLYFLFGRGGANTAAAPADTTVTATTTPDSAPVAAAPQTPVMAYAKWADTAKTPATNAEAATFVANGLHLLVPALRERAPMAGVQHLMVAAMADTVGMPNTPQVKQTDAAQAAFFAAAYAMRDRPAGGELQSAASAIQLKKPLAQQRAGVDHFFFVAGKVLLDSAAQVRTPAQGAAPAAPAPGKR